MARNFEDILMKMVTTTDQRLYYCACKGKAATCACSFTADHICDHESQTHKKSNLYVFDVFAQCFKTNKVYLCYAVDSYIEIPPLHLFFPRLY